MHHRQVHELSAADADHYAAVIIVRGAVHQPCVDGDIRAPGLRKSTRPTEADARAAYGPGHRNRRHAGDRKLAIAARPRRRDSASVLSAHAFRQAVRRPFHRDPPAPDYSLVSVRPDVNRYGRL